MPDTALNPALVWNLRALADEGTREMRHVVLEPDLLHKLLDVAETVAQPEITSIEELEELPYGSLIQDSSGETVLRFDGPNYDWITGVDGRYRMDEQVNYLPARVIFRPKV